MNKTEKVLCFSPYAAWQLHASYEIALCHNLQWRRHSYLYVGCDGLFSDCDLFWEAAAGPRPKNACAACQKQVTTLLDTCRIPHTWLGKYNPPDGESSAQAFTKALRDDELLAAEYRGYPVGQWIKSSVHTHLRINTIDLRNPKHCAALRSYLYSGAVAINCLSQLLDQERPTILLLFNGRMSVTRIALELAQERGIRVVCHERGLAKETLLLWENENCLSLRPYEKFGAEWRDIPLSKSEVSKVTRWLTDRAHGTNLNWKTFSVQSSLGDLEAFLNAHQGKTLWTLFTSSTDEIAAQTEQTSAFGTQYKWIERTIEIARSKPDVALVVRVHPNSGGKKSTGKNLGELAFFESLQSSLPSNVALVMPDDKVSSYALAERTDLGLVYVSTIALEMACRGKKVFLAARTPWIYCSTLELITDETAYEATLENSIGRKTGADESVRIATGAFRFAYAYIHRWNIRFPLVQMPDVHNGSLTAKTLDELRPGVHDCLDYCAEIVLGIRPSIPRVTHPPRKGADTEERVAIHSALAELGGDRQPRPIRVSVIVTCYNYGKFLREAVRSVANQTFEDLEIIIVNDGSTDDSGKVADACVQEFKHRPITVIHQTNSGQPALARNAGIRKASGEFILPLDADDRIEATYLEEAFKAIDADPRIDLVYADSLFDNGKRRERKKAGFYTLPILSKNNQIVYCSVYRRSLWEKIGGYRDNVRGYEDWDFWIATCLLGARAAYVQTLGLLYNEKDGGVYSQTVAHHETRYARVMLNNPAAYTREQLSKASSSLAITTAEPAPSDEPSLESIRQTASKRYQAGDWSGCVDACTQALKISPDDCDVLLVYADALAKTGQVPAALAAMERVIRLEPDNEDHKQMRAGFVAMLSGASQPGLVSVVIPCFNQAQYLVEAIDSVIAQTYSKWEIIIVNDGSPDDTNAVAQSLILQHPKHAIRLVEKANGGLSDARNAGIRFARGEFILPLDADDKIHSEFLTKTVGLLEKNPDVGIAYTDWVYFGAHTTSRQALDYNFEQLCTKENLFTCTSLYRKSAWIAAGGYNPNMTKGLEDWDFWINCGKHGFTGRRIPEPLFFYRAKRGSMIHTAQPHVRAMFARIVLNHSDIYNASLVESAHKTLAAADVPPPKPSSPGTEWTPSGDTAPQSSTIVAKKNATSSPPNGLVSVIIPCYNQAQYLVEAVESVVAQTYKNWEAIIVNDGSPDTTSQTAADLIAKHPGCKIRLLEKPNGGISDARNAGIREALGDYILPLDADDKIDPEMLAKTAALLNAHPEIAIAYTDYVYFGHQNQRLWTREYNFKTLCTAYNQFTCTSLYRKAAWIAVGGYNTNMRNGYEDWDFWIACGSRGFIGKRIPEVLFHYRTKAESRNADAKNNHQALFSRMVLNHPHLYSADFIAQSTRTLLAAEKAEKIGSAKKKPTGNNAPPLVSICIPTYNGQDFLAETIASALAQTYPAIEIILSDDNSSDRTVEVAEMGLKNSRFPVRILKHERLGLVGNWTYCIEQARGKYIKFLFQDDLLEPECAAQLVEVAEQAPDIGLVFSQRRIEKRASSSENKALATAYRDGLDLHKAWSHLASLQSGVALLNDPKLLLEPVNKIGEPTTVLLSKAAIEKVGGFDANLKQLVDAEMWLRIMTKYRIGFVDRVLSCFRLHEKQTTQTNQKAGLIIEDWKRFFKKIATDPVFAGLPVSHHDYARHAVLQLEERHPTPKPPAPVKPVPDEAAFHQAIQLAEGMVRSGQINEAIARTEYALSVAPDSECARRASEILEMLRGGSSEPSPDNGSAPDREDSGEIFGADEVKTIEQLIAAHSENPDDASIRAQLEELQQGLMNFLVTAETEKLETLFKGSFGRVFRAVSKSGLVAEPTTEKSQAQVAILDEAIATPSTDGVFDCRPVLARMICTPAHRGSLTIPLEKIPAWFHDDYLAHVLHAPAVFVYANEAEEYHDHMLAWARAISLLTRSAPNDAATLAAVTYFATKASYIPLYFSNRNTREVAEKRAAIMEFFLVKNGATIDFKSPKRPKDRKKIKVGYLSAHFGQQTETHVTLPTLQLDQEKFEICLFPLKSNPGPVEDRCRSFADSFTPLPANIHQQVKIIRDAALDVVIIGTNVTAVTNQISLIALHRLAPLQLVNYCSPVSTGMRHIDGYLTGTLNALPGLQEHFTEKLQFCEGPPGCLDYTVETKTASSNFTRASLGLNETDIVFVNAAACFKILPEMQETWAKILKAVPNSRLLLLPFNPNWSNAFPVKQFERTLTEACARHGVSRDRFVLAGSLPSRADVKALERVADVYLDTFPFSGSISVIDPLELGLPPVVREGQTHRSRMAAALLRELEIPELIVQDEAAYIALSVKLATDRAFRSQMSERILEAMSRKPKFINPQRYAEGLSELIETLVTGKKSPATVGAGV
jgi:glycosyltransferase involved in cell wall biosynthesis/predicted O-linked N-acetylglucosamine transferase (SPINDLY family)